MRNGRLPICKTLRVLAKKIVYSQAKSAENGAVIRTHLGVVGEQTRVYRCPRIVIESCPDTLKTRTADLPALNVYELSKAQVADDKGHVLDGRFFPIAETFVQRDLQPSPVLNRWRARKHQVLQYEDLAVLGSEVSENNYYHWVIEALPRLELIRLAGIPVSKYLIHCSLAFQKDLLGLAGIGKGEIVPLERGITYTAKRLVVPSLLNNSYSLRTGSYSHYFAKYFHPWVCGFYDRIANAATTQVDRIKGPARVFISRKHASVRRLVNEDDVVHTLRQASFQVSFLEEMSVIDQIRTFRDAEVVVAPHGAGLTNLVFGSKRLAVFELFCSNYAPNFYWLLANEKGQDYGCLLGEPSESSVGRDPALADYRVDLDKLAKGLHEMIGL